MVQLIDATYVALPVLLAVAVLAAFLATWRTTVRGIAEFLCWLRRLRLRYRLLHLCWLLVVCAIGAKLATLVDWSAWGWTDIVVAVETILLAAFVSASLLYLYWVEHFSQRRRFPVPPTLPQIESQETDRPKQGKVRFKMRREQQSGFKW